jgi:tRNA U34 5-methylaminomethyl-2-thiouridine-forming methyltransferase MnmC
MKKENNNERQGIYLPAEVFLNSNLDRIECLLFGLIDYFDRDELHCQVENNFFAILLNTHKKVITASISHLKQLGYITVEFQPQSKNPDRRIISIRPAFKSINYKLNDVLNKKIQNYLSRVNKGKEEI